MRVCPFCGSRIRLSECDVVATNLHQTAARGFDQLGSGAPGATPPSRTPVLGYHGDYPVIWKGRAQEDSAGTSRGLLGVLYSPAQPALKELDSLPVEDLPRRVCSACEVPIPSELDEMEAHILAIVGLNAAGKTHYLAAALTEATRQQGLAPIGCGGFTPCDDTATRLHQNYYVPVFREGEVLAFTPIDPNVRHKPLTFRVAFGQGGQFLLMMHDVSGEILSDHRQRAAVAPFVRRASALIFLVDPLEFDQVRAGLPKSALPPARSIHQADLLSACLHELQYAPGGRDVPVAVTISKSDILDSVLGEQFRFSQPTAVNEWVDDVRKTSDEVRDLLLRLGEKDLVAAAAKHSQVTFHAVSALGSTPIAGSVMSNPVPRRCLDPLGTVLLRLNSAVS